MGDTGDIRITGFFERSLLRSKTKQADETARQTQFYLGRFALRLSLLAAEHRHAGKRRCRQLVRPRKHLMHYHEPHTPQTHTKTGGGPHRSFDQPNWMLFEHLYKCLIYSHYLGKLKLSACRGMFRFC